MSRSTGSRISIAACAAVLALGGLLPGCGSSGGGPVADYELHAGTTMLPAKPPIAKPEFIARVNEICRNAWVEVAGNWRSFLEDDNPETGRPTTFAEAVRGPLLTGIDFYIFDGIQVLGSPRGEEEAIEAIIGPFQRSVELGQMGLWRVRSLSEVPRHFTEYNRRARRYGLADDCLVSQAHLRVFRMP